MGMPLRNLSQEQQGGKSILVCQQQIKTTQPTVFCALLVTLHPGAGAASGRREHEAHKHSANLPSCLSWTILKSLPLTHPEDWKHSHTGIVCVE